MSKYVSHPGEIIPITKLIVKQAKLKNRLENNSPEWEWCFDLLRKTSRSFYFVILGIHPDFVRPIAVFYLIARALDSIVGANPNEIRLLQEYGNLAKCYNSLKPVEQRVITDSIKEMGFGMNEFLDQDIISLAQYDKYCYYVAGLVGINTIELTIATKVCAPFSIPEEAKRSGCNSARLLLQKINIIRDIREDLLQIPQPRIFWPKEVWSKYAEKLDDFLLPGNKQAAINCCNELILNAIPHVFDGISLYPNVSELTCRNMIGISFTMAVAMLGLCYNNEKVFTSAVKLKKGETAWIYDNCTDIASFMRLVKYYSCKLKVKMEANKEKRMELIKKCIKKCDELIRAHGIGK
ncbi:Botryococcus squalene synthase [Folsomia candida]|uniref:Botryococcus squalene synthase n=1 Tax=Folsomia candida TaxID=158441 RepID=A0A226DV35_FOLCA|nr:Botryococcus squalene synthase [Folsomia candida]